MKKILLIALIFCWIIPCAAQLRATVDERIELTSIVFRIAEIPEYMNNNVPDYALSIDRWFQPYKNHPLIAFIKKMRTQNRIAYAAVTGSAPYLIIEKGEVKVNTCKSIEKVDPRWTEEVFDEYVSLLNNFYAQSHFDEFFKSQKVLYSEGQKAMNGILEQVDVNWFETFYGKKVGSPSIYLALANGPHNYVLDDPTSLSGYGIANGCIIDPSALSLFANRIIPVIIHEIGHNFSDPLVEIYWSQVELSFDKLYDNSRIILKQYAYGDPNTALLEWQNNLFMLMYLKEHDPENYEYNLADMVRRGFMWMPRSVDFMKNFEENRSQFKIIEDFIPQISDFIIYTSERSDRVMDEYEHIVPYVVNIYPIPNSNLLGYKNLKEIRITFSEAMDTNSKGLEIIQDENSPLFVNINKAYWKDELTLMIPLTGILIPNQEYGIRLNQNYTNSLRSFGLAEDIEIKYNTQKL